MIDLNAISIKIYREGKIILEQTLQNCSVKDGSLFADPVFDIPKRPESYEIFCGDKSLYLNNTVKIETTHIEESKYMVLWNNNGICKI